MDWLLCCGGTDESAPMWFDESSEPSFVSTTWGKAVEYCTAKDRELCPYSVYCPAGGGSPPLGGTKSGDKWSPMADGANRWVQVGIWGGSASNTCLGHHQIAGGVHGAQFAGATRRVH
jgi:hypothetical protein